MKAFKKVTNKISNSKIIKNPVFLLIGLIVIILVIALIYFIFLKYSPIMNFKYEGYAISGKDITENLLGSSEDSTINKNLELAKIEEQGTIFKKLNDYFVGNKEKTEINLNYPIYINENSAIYNLAENSTLISKDFEEIAGYPNLSIAQGKVYDGNNLERADAKEYIFVKTSDDIFINLYEIKIKTTANEYTIPVNSIVAFTENSIRCYTINNNVLVFKQINDIDNNSNVQIVENNYTYEELLTRLGIIKNESNNTENNKSQDDIIQEDTNKTDENLENLENDNTIEQEQSNETNTTEEPQNGYVKPEVTVEDFTAEVYTAKSRLTIKDPAGRIVEAPTFEIYKDGKIYLRRTFNNSGEIQITGLVPETEYEIIGKFIYLNEEGQKVENTFYDGRFTTKGYEELGNIDITKENGEIYSNKIQLTKVKITSDLNAEVMKGINQVEIETGEIRTVLKNNQVNSLLRGEEITIESSEGLKSNSNINYAIKFYDKNGIELKVNNNEGETRTSKEAPTARVSIKKQDIVSVTLRLNLTNKDNVELENYKYVVTRANGETVQEERLAENEKEIELNDLDQNQYYKIGIYADYDLNDNKGKQENVELGNLVFATQPISTLGSLELTVENKELTSTNSTISYKIDEERTDKRLIQILNELTINIKDGEKIVKTDTLTGEEISNLQQAGTKEIKYENLESNTTYTIEITGNVQLGNTQESIPVTYNYREFTTLKSSAKVEIKNQFVTGSLIDFDVRIEDKDNAVLNNKIRMELRDEDSNLITLEELETNQDYVRKTYEKLEENRTYKLRFIAEQYNEGNTDATYKVNYLIQELEIITEPGVSGGIGLTELTRKATGKNLVDVTSETKWYVYPNFNLSEYSYYGKEYNEETKTLTLGGHSNNRRAVYDLREYAGQEVTMSFKAKAVSGSQTACIQNSKKDENRTQIQGLTTEWKDFQYTLTVDSTGYLGFYINGGNGIEIKELQIELGNRKTSYEEFKYTLASNYSINLEDRRDEITTNDYYIKVYEDNNLVKNERYEEIPEENIITNAIKTYETQSGKQYKAELTIRIKDREYVLSEIEYNTQDTEEIKGIYNKEDFLEIQPMGHYIVLGDIDLTGGSGTKYRFGSDNLPFEGTIDFNGYTLIRDAMTVYPIFQKTGESAILKNLIFDISLNNQYEISEFIGLVGHNYGQIKNIQINLKECNDNPNLGIYFITAYNYNLIENFTINLENNLYVDGNLGMVVLANSGIVQNGYLYGKDIIVTNSRSTNKNIGGIVCENRTNGSIENVYNLTNIKLIEEKLTDSTLGNIVSINNANSEIRNCYSSGTVEKISKTIGPVIGNNHQGGITERIYYFFGETKNNTYNQKTTPLALWDTTFQNQILNSENAFNVDELVTQGYYPQLNWPDCMPAQEYIELPEVEDKDLPDILSMEVLESTNDTAKVKFSVNNPSAETITNIKIENLNCDILSQEYNDGTSDVIAELNNPIICVSGYSVLGITTKGAYNQEYTREFEENERLIDVELYREINSISDWEAINKSLTENYKLMTDLDMRNQGANICIYGYKGIFNGDNHVIKNINIPSNKPGLFVAYLSGTIKNLYVENLNIMDNNLNNVGFIAGISSGGKVENVHIKDIKIQNNYSTSTEINIGGIAGWNDSGAIINSSINNLSISSNNGNDIIVGGIIAHGYLANIENCYVSNFNINVKGYTNNKIGGIEGSGSANNIKNSYAIGKIESDSAYVGGIEGYDQINIQNCYSKVEIISDNDYIGGIGGNSTTSASRCNQNLSIGNIYSSKYTQNMRRMIGNLELTGSNYAYSNQRINGYISEENMGASDLLTYEELTDKNTYLNKLSWGNIYDISEVNKGILPKLKYKDSDELLPNQEDVHLEAELILDIENVESSKDDINNVSVRIDINNPQELEVTGIEIEGMNHTISSIVTRDGGTYINLTASPIYCYDTYRISKIKYKIDGIEYEKEVAVRIEQQFYKELYNFEDWQSIDVDGGTYQNYRLMSNIDFSGRTNINTNVTMARLEAVGGTKTLKNIDLTFTGTENGLIKDITTKLSDVRFENIKINFESGTSNVGIIGTESGNMENTEFSEVTIIAENSTKVGSVGYSTAVMDNIRMEKVTVHGNYRVGGLVGEGTGEILNTNADDINVTGNYDNTGGIIGYAQSKLENITVNNSNVSGQNNIGGMSGYQEGAINKNSSALFVDNSNIEGNNNVGGIHGYLMSYGGGKKYIFNSTITGNGNNIGGIVGNNSGGSSTTSAKVVNCEIKGIGANSNSVGGISGLSHATVQNAYIQDSKVTSNGSNIGGLVGENDGHQITIYTNYAMNVEIEGYNNVGGFIGDAKQEITLSTNYISGSITAVGSNIGGLVGTLNNSAMTAVSNTSSILDNYVANTEINGNNNVGGLIGEIQKELYMPESFYYGNYVETNIKGKGALSLGIGNMPNQNQYLKNTYYYKYSSVNGESPNEQNEIFIPQSAYLIEADLKEKTTYTSKLKWQEAYWNFDVIENNKYPILSSTTLTDQEGIDLPKDSEHKIESEENSVDIQSIGTQEEPEQVIEYNNKTIQTYSTYSLITAKDGTKAIRNAKLYVKDNNLYAIPNTLSESANGDKSIVPVANNLIIDSYNGKEYETVLGSDGKIYDLNEPIEYPENFVNSDIESIGNNLNSDIKEIEVTYKNGDKIKFNYQTGEVISSSEAEEKTGLFDYLEEKIAEIGENSANGVSQEITNKYEESKELQTKLEKTSVEEAIEKQNTSELEEGIEGVTITENNVTNNSLTENKYISVYDEEIDDYLIYNEEELLDTTKEEVVSENEKIEANNLSEYYASEGETRNTKMGIVWIVISIIGVGIILFVLRKNLKKKNA